MIRFSTSWAVLLTTIAFLTPDRAHADITFSGMTQLVNASSFAGLNPPDVFDPISTDGTPMVTSDVDGDATASISTTIEQDGRDWVITSTSVMYRPPGVLLNELQMYIDVTAPAGFLRTDPSGWTYEADYEMNWLDGDLGSFVRTGTVVLSLFHETGIEEFREISGGRTTDTETFSASGNLKGNTSRFLFSVTLDPIYYDDEFGVEQLYDATRNLEGVATLRLLAPPTIPEPSSMVLLGIGAVGLIGAARKRLR